MCEKRIFVLASNSRRIVFERCDILAKNTYLKGCLILWEEQYRMVFVFLAIKLIDIFVVHR